MATSKEYKDYIIDELSFIGDITYKPMMGEYLLYYKNILFGGIYDDRLLVKKTDTNNKYNLEESIPYDGAKAMYLVDDVDNIDTLKSIVEDTYEGLINNSK